MNSPESSTPASAPEPGGRRAEPGGQRAEPGGQHARQSAKSRRIGIFRLTALLTALAPVVLLVVASRLEPSARGLGTHQQLGLPPCSMRVLFGIRCPGCGMTTSWAHFTRGRFQQSWLVNRGGFLLAWFSIAVAGLALQSCVAGRLPSAKTQKSVTLVLVGIGIVTLLDWGVRLAAGA